MFLRSVMATCASKAVSVEISGGAMIFRGEVPVVLEVNASLGFRGLREATMASSVDAIVDYAIEKADSGAKPT